MGAGWFIACEDSGPKPLPNGGRALLFAQFHLEEFARESGLPPIKKFFSSDPQAIMRYLHEQGIETTADDLPDEQWHEPADILPTLRMLIVRLDEDPGPVQQLEKVRADLAAMLAIIESANNVGERFHVATAMPDLTDREQPGTQSP